jgi:hypothetical protein
MAGSIEPSRLIEVISFQPRITSMQLNKLWIAAAAGITIVSGSALAQDLFAYPPEGRPKAQQQQDQFECHQWAVEQTHFDPVQYAAQSASGQSTPAATTPASNPSGAANPPGGQSSRQAATLASGAAQGAAVARVSGGNPGEGAAAGAVLRALQGRMGARAAEEQRQREAQAARQAQLQQAQLQQAQTQQAQQQEVQARRKAYQQARATCFKARGYTVSAG